VVSKVIYLLGLLVVTCILHTAIGLLRCMQDLKIVIIADVWLSVWSIAVCFYELCCILTNPQGESNSKNEWKYTAILHTETSNEGFIIQLNLFQPFSVTWKKTMSVMSSMSTSHGTVQ